VAISAADTGRDQNINIENRSKVKAKDMNE